jgi:hypothetical protein
MMARRFAPARWGPEPAGWPFVSPTGRAIWEVSLVGNARRRAGLLWPDGGVSLAPDGSGFLRVTPDHELRVEPVQGCPRRVVRLGNDDWIATAVWTPDGERVFFLRGDAPTALETFAVFERRAVGRLHGAARSGYSAIGPQTATGG